MIPQQSRIRPRMLPYDLLPRSTWLRLQFRYDAVRMIMLPQTGPSPKTRIPGGVYGIKGSKVHGLLAVSSSVLSQVSTARGRLQRQRLVIGRFVSVGSAQVHARS